ncbi:dTDP-4-dehydrorhamnose reductase [Bordetella trematum]|uniref:dTDP-4-dehydrorhamnose reductase n=1 Tax=Bordetella trematum TaxID=123899 RepID=A0A157SDX3_9BORD|nr:dTDP-4-dehydrorhamnose reductase [Bordetella trematum]
MVAQARALGRPLGLREITAVSSACYPTPAVRPLDTRLDCARLQAVFGLRLPPWREGIDRLLRQWCASPWADAP